MPWPLKSSYQDASRGDGGIELFMTADAVGGVFQYALDLAGALAAHNVRTTLALLGPPANDAQRAMAAGVPGLRLLHTGLPLDWLADDLRSADDAAAAIAELANWHGAHVVHLNAPALACAAYDVPVVAVLHSCLASWWEAVKRGPLPEDFRWRTALTAHGVRCADAVVCPSAAFAARAHTLYGRKPRVVHNGRNLPPRANAPEYLAKLAFTAGRLWDEGKNVGVLDEAVPMMDVPLVAAGPIEGPNGARIDLPNVRTLGEIGERELRARLEGRPIFVSSALYEPFGLAVLDAAQAGCPLVLSDIPTFRELWDGAAHFVPADDPPAFAFAVNRLVRDPLLRAAASTAARERSERYSTEALASQMAEIYRLLRDASSTHRSGAAA
jgi:glycosyltransferase involved in cell wall biosynthesis